MDEKLELLLSAYHLAPDNIIAREDGWMLECGQRLYVLHSLKGETFRWQTALGWQRSLQEKRKGLVPEVLLSTSGQDHISIEGSTYYLMASGAYEGFLSDNTAHLEAAAKSLASLHALSRDYQATVHTEDLLGPKMIQNRLASLIWYYKNFKACRQKSEFAGIYTEHFSFIYDQGQESLEKMVLGGYEAAMKERSQILLNSFCPRRLGIAGEEAVFLELDRWTIGLEVMDLALLLNSFLPRYKWDASLTLRLLEGYESSHKLQEQDKHLLLALLRFPYRFWLYAWQYYNRVMSAPELTRKLENYIYESFLRDKCLDGLDNWLWRD